MPIFTVHLTYAPFSTYSERHNIEHNNHIPTLPKAYVIGMVWN